MKPNISDDPVADGLLLRIRKRPGHRYRIDRLARQMHRDRAELVAAAKRLTGCGYRIRKGKETLAFISVPDLMTPSEISFHLKTKVLGRHIYAYQSVKSTNDVARELAEQGAHEGTIVVADRQTKGRGRLGRSWHSPAGTGIYLSILLRPGFSPERAPGLSIMTGLALAITLERYCRHRVKLKWPNDLWIGGKKAAGILTELSAERGRIEYVVVGVGINVNQRRADFPEDLRASATSIRLATRRKQSRVRLLAEFLKSFEHEYAHYSKKGLRPSAKRLTRYSALLGANIRLAYGPRVLEARVVKIDAEGRLVIEHGGEIRTVSSGEVSVIKPG